MSKNRKPKPPIWQITFPLCAVLMFGIATFAALRMAEGRYIFDVNISRNGIKIRTDVDKRDRPSLPDKVAENDDRDS